MMCIYKYKRDHIVSALHTCSTRFSISIYSELKLRMSLFDFLSHVDAIPFNLYHYRNILYTMRIKRYFYQTFRFLFEELF